jgi:hypothetical protein
MAWPMSVMREHDPKVSVRLAWSLRAVHGIMVIPITLSLPKVTWCLANTCSSELSQLVRVLWERKGRGLEEREGREAV